MTWKLQSRAWIPTLREAPGSARSRMQVHFSRAGFLRPLPGGSNHWLPHGEALLNELEALLTPAFEAAGIQPVRLPASPPRPEDLAALSGGDLTSYRQLPLGFRTPASILDSRFVPRVGWLGCWFLEDPQEGLEELSQDLSRLAQGLGFELQTQLQDLGQGQLLGSIQAGSEASFTWRVLPETKVPPRKDLPAPESLETPGTKTIAELSDFLGVSPQETAKSVLYQVEGGPFLACMVRGDQDVDPEILARLVYPQRLRVAKEDEVRAAGSVPGYAGPEGLREDVLLWASPEVMAMPSVIAGANRENFHRRGLVPGRDFTPTRVLPLSNPGPTPGADLLRVQSLGLVDPAPEVSVLDPQGKRVSLQPLGLFLDLEAWLEALPRPEELTPLPPQLGAYDLHVLVLDAKKAEILEVGKELAQEASGAGYRVLLDDRRVSAGEKFQDADLLGVPQRLLVSRRGLKEGQVELRGAQDRQGVPLELEGFLDSLAPPRAKACPSVPESPLC